MHSGAAGWRRCPLSNPPTRAGVLRRLCSGGRIYLDGGVGLFVGVDLIWSVVEEPGILNFKNFVVGGI